MEKKLEYTKFEERLNFAIELLKKNFPGASETDLMHEACEIAKTLFVRSEIQYSGRRE